MVKGRVETIDEYIQEFPGNVQCILERVRQTIRNAAPEAEEAISYQIPTFKLNSKNLVHFAAFKNHIGFYPIPSAIEAFKKELSVFKQGKDSVQFPIVEPIPLELIGRIVEFRVKEIMKKDHLTCPQ